MSDDVKTLFPDFFSSPNFSSESEHMQAEIVALVIEFINKGFEVWPEWRGIHSTNQNMVWTLKTENRAKKSEFDNVVTIYQMSGRLKVEVYYGANNKPAFYYSRFDENTELFEEAIYNYQHNLGKRIILKEKEELKEEILEIGCPFKIDEHLAHKKKGDCRVIEINDKVFKVMWEDGNTSFFQNKDALQWFKIK